MSNSIFSPRATIIDCSSSLIHGMAREVATNLRSDDSPQRPHYLDALPMLGENGFKNIVPEMASVVAGQVMADGTYLGDYFDTPNRYLDGKKLGQFLKDAARGNLAGMSVEPAQRPPENVRDYIDGLYEILGTKHLTRRKDGVEDRGNSPRILTAKAIANHHRHHSSLRDGFGGMVRGTILSMMENEYAQGAQGTPVFVLTNDAVLITRLGEERTIRPKQLFYSLAETGLHARMGIRSSATPMELEAEIRKAATQTGHTDVSKGGEEPVFARKYKDHPLHALLEQAAAERGMSEKKAATSLKPASGAQVDKFRRRQELAQSSNTQRGA